MTHTQETAVSQNADKGLVMSVNDIIKKELADAGAVRALLATTFKDFDENLMKQAIMEGMLRGFTFQNFVQRDVYAIKYNSKDGPTYSLVTSIGHARKIGMHSGIIGKSAPQYEYKDENREQLESCTVTVKRAIPKTNHVGEYTQTVFFDEYFKKGTQYKPSMWETKPKTMIAKVAEMHALRMACPEKMSEMYTEEEMEQVIHYETRHERAKVESESLKMGNLEKNEADAETTEG